MSIFLSDQCHTRYFYLARNIETKNAGISELPGSHRMLDCTRLLGGAPRQRGYRTPASAGVTGPGTRGVSCFYTIFNFYTKKAKELCILCP